MCGIFAIVFHIALAWKMYFIGKWKVNETQDFSKTEHMTFSKLFNFECIKKYRILYKFSHKVLCFFNVTKPHTFS